MILAAQWNCTGNTFKMQMRGLTPDLINYNLLLWELDTDESKVHVTDSEPAPLVHKQPDSQVYAKPPGSSPREFKVPALVYGTDTDPLTCGDFKKCMENGIKGVCFDVKPIRNPGVLFSHNTQFS